MSNVWFTADLHIGHAKVAETRGFLDDDPNAAIEAHDAVLAAKWDHNIKPEDHIWILGDISAGGRNAQTNALTWLAQRPGTKHLIAGNHDGCHPMHRDAATHARWYLSSGIASVQAYARRRIAGRQVLLSHFPYDGDHTTEQRFNQYRLPDFGVPILHGHTHSRERVSWSHGEAPTLQIHVGVDGWGYLKPVHVDEIAAILEEAE